MPFNIYIDGEATDAELEAFKVFADTLLRARRQEGQKPVETTSAATKTIGAKATETPKPKAASAPAPKPKAFPGSTQAAEAPEVEAPTIQDAIRVASELVTTGRSKEVKNTLEQFGVMRVSELQAENIAEFIAAIEAL